MKATLRVSLFFVFAATAAFCEPIIFTFAGTATGTLGTSQFSDASFIVTSLADTNAANLVGSIYEVTAINSTISIQGQPVATFSDPTYWSVPQGSADIIFGDLTTNPSFFPGLLGITQFAVGLETYNLQSSFGPVFSAFDFPSTAFGTFQNIPTNQGPLSLVASNETFTATTVPEPRSFALLGLALGSLAGLLKARSTPTFFNRTSKDRHFEG